MDGQRAIKFRPLFYDEMMRKISKTHVFFIYLLFTIELIQKKQQNNDIGENFLSCPLFYLLVSLLISIQFKTFSHSISYRYLAFF